MEHQLGPFCGTLTHGRSEEAAGRLARACFAASSRSLVKPQKGEVHVLRPKSLVGGPKALGTPKFRPVYRADSPFIRGPIAGPTVPMSM